MSKLISGKEALIALANGEGVEFLHKEVWDCVGEMIILKHFTEDKFKFRLKPRTITINGIEIPAPFEPEDGDKYWYIDSDGTVDSSSWDSHQIDKDRASIFGVWHTEKEIKQVVAALRKVFEVQP